MIYCLYGLERQSELLERKNMNFKELPERLDREVIYYMRAIMFAYMLTR